MENDFKGVMSKRTDPELYQIINSKPGDYQPSALEAAKIEFEKRNISYEQVIIIKDEIKQKLEVNTVKSKEPLGVMAKILASLFPGIFMIMFAGTYKADGYDRKAKEIVRWTIYGICFYIGIAVIIFLMSF